MAWSTQPRTQAALFGWGGQRFRLRAVVVLGGQFRLASLLLLLDGCLRALSEFWHLPERDFRTI
jgi:hypothetical protein